MALIQIADAHRASSIAYRQPTCRNQHQFPPGRGILSIVTAKDVGRAALGSVQTSRRPFRILRRSLVTSNQGKSFSHSCTASGSPMA